MVRRIEPALRPAEAKRARGVRRMLADRISLPLGSLDDADAGAGPEIALFNLLGGASPAGSDPGSGALRGALGHRDGPGRARSCRADGGNARRPHAGVRAPPFGITRGRRMDVRGLDAGVV